MPYCQNCGTKNEEGAQVCANCQEPLYDTRRRRARHDGCYGPRGERRPEEECFGLPYGGAIVGILLGLVLLVYGAAWIVSLTLGISLNGQLVAPLIAITIGILILAGAIYRLSHRS